MTSGTYMLLKRDCTHLSGGLTPSGGNAITGLTVSDSYPVNAATLVY